MSSHLLEVALRLSSNVGAAALREFVRIASGRFLTEEQIRRISQDTVGSYFSDWLPTPKEEVDALERVEKARSYINEATRIVLALQNDLDHQAQQLDQMIKEIEEKKKLADHYESLAKLNRNTFSAFRAEMEEALRKELRAEAEKGRRVRQVVSVAIWLITLFLGAALSTYFIPFLEMVKKWLNI